MSKRTVKKKKTSILKLKVLSEETETAKDELDTGVLELNEILNEFSKNVNLDQKKDFDQFFFGDRSIPDSKSNETGTCELSTKNLDCQKKTEPKPAKDRPQWIKKIYKQVVQRTHPDRYIDFPVKEIKEKFKNVYMNAVTAYESNDIGILLLCAYDAQVSIDHPDAEKYILDSMSDQTKTIKEIKNKIAYQWYHLPDVNRMYFLEVYLKKLGYVFEKEKAERVIKRKKIKRKAGTRPEKMRVNRKKIN